MRIGEALLGRGWVACADVPVNTQSATSPANSISTRVLGIDPF
jgi:hypothetical protein